MSHKKYKGGDLSLDVFRFRDRDLSNKIVERLRSMNLNLRLMHVCGTHQDTIVRHGLDSLLKECGVDIRQGPGCPVCVTTQREYEEAAALAREGKVIATYGDAARVPGEHGSLLDLKSEGFDVSVVYSISDAVKLAKNKTKNVVFLAVGFETTAPSTAATILSHPPNNFSVLTCHRYIPPALHALLEMGEVKIQGLIEPGHVSTIIGAKPYESLSEKFHIPQVIAGFEPLDLLMAVYMLSRQIMRGEAKVENEYERSVRYDGNPKALQILKEVFEPNDVAWRGFPVIPDSGMKLKNEFEKHDARRIFEAELEDIPQVSHEQSKGCKCGEILRGLVDSKDCPLFRVTCTPSHPIGPCMVSMEGSCNIEYRSLSRELF